MTDEERIEKHIVAVLVDNEPGVLARVIGLFSGRGYNIESLTVAEVDPKENLSRITIVTSGTPMVIEQIKAQLGRIVSVHKVSDLTEEGPFVERELALIKVAGTGDKRVESLRIADVFRAGAKSYRDLHRVSVEEPERFWPEVVADLGIGFSRPWDQLLDVSGIGEATLADIEPYVHV